ncbi:MAG TPA: VWA domain-containing protein [Blastocatellia bacterium]|nr:VWA domain-containing protein [Blastocatellia bacterium]
MCPFSWTVSIKYLKIAPVLLLLTCSLDGRILAQQEGASSAAASRTRYLAETGFIPTSREVAVEEFINYHRHQIGRPKAGEAVALDVRWGSNVISEDNPESVLQLGFSTALVNDRQQLGSINLALVIDKSGSMADSDKMSRVKAALVALVSQLRDTDVLSISLFDSYAEVLLPARTLTDRGRVLELIRQIEPGGSTNLHAGLMLGYHEALKHYRKDATNRVILLTDGIANQGVTDPEKIAGNSLAFNERGIDLSTIGVGLDLNQDLLRQLAKSGRGLFHFVADAQDLHKVFIKELQSLLSLVATEPRVEVSYHSDLHLAQVYGYEPELHEDSVALKLDNMNQGLTQVVLLRFKAAPHSIPKSSLAVRVRFTYYDISQKKQVVQTQDSSIALKASGAAWKDDEVRKNYTIALLAQAIREMAVSCEMRHYGEAESLLTTAIARTRRSYPNLEDEDIARTLAIAEKYQKAIRREIRSDRE